MRRRAALLLVLLLAAQLVSGCWSSHELNDLSIVVGLGIDLEGDKYKVTVQVVNPGQVAVKKQGGSPTSPVITYEETGVTIPEAVRRMTVKAPRAIYFAHMRIVVLGSDLAQSGISRPLDYISRDLEMRNDFYLVIAKNATASDILKTFSSIDPIPANNMYTKLETSDKLWAATAKMTLVQLLQDLSKQGKSPTMTGIEIIGDRSASNKASNGQYISPPVMLTYSGTAVFMGDRMVGWLDETETKALNYVQNNVVHTVGFVSCPRGDGNISMEVARSKTRIAVNTRRGEPEFDVYLRLEQNISDIECGTDMSDVDIITDLKRQTDLKLKRMIEDAIRKVQQKYGTDVFGFGDVLHGKAPEAWHAIKDWNEVFTHVKVRVHVNSILRRTGTILQPVQHQMER